MDKLLEPIGVIHSCFKDKFGVPRQPGLVTTASARLEIFAPYDKFDAFSGLENFSHLWITFVFHHNLVQTQRLSVRPPRLGGNRKLGVFASRSGFRPNSLGISVVRQEGLMQNADGVSIMLNGVDLIDGTPVLDIKPYVPDSDAVHDARAGYAQQAPQVGFEVRFGGEAEQQCERFTDTFPVLRQLITEILSYDPRPAYLSSQSSERHFIIRIYEFKVYWRVLPGGIVEVFAIYPDVDSVEPG